MLPDRVSNPGPLTYKSGVLPIALRSPALYSLIIHPSMRLFSQHSRHFKLSFPQVFEA